MPALKEGEPKPAPKTDAESCDPKKLEEKLKNKVPRLPRRIAAHIRDLKQQGKFEEAMSLRKRVIDRKTIRYQREIAVLDELDKNTYEMICTDDPVKEAVANINIVWLFNAIGQIETTDERNREIIEILNKVPSVFQPKVKAELPAIRNKMEKFMPSSSPKPLAI